MNDRAIGNSVVFIAGPTAAGKSAAAMTLASRIGGEIVNADAMQVYRDLRIVTARPSPQDEAAVPHHLYGALDGAERCSAGRWARMAVQTINGVAARGRTAILVGGTGLYFRALEEGLSPIPEAPEEIRARASARRSAIGPHAFREEVLARDPAMARLPEGDVQRLLRAWEVFEATGKPLSHFQSLPRAPLIDGPIRKAVIAPPREALYARCEARAQAMLEEGAIEEVRALLERRLNENVPVMKALGVPEIAALLRGEKTRGETLEALQQNTRRFAKRQLTWFRNQAKDWSRYDGAEAAAASLAPVAV